MIKTKQNATHPKYQKIYWLIKDSRHPLVATEWLTKQPLMSLSLGATACQLLIMPLLL